MKRRGFNVGSGIPLPESDVAQMGSIAENTAVVQAMRKRGQIASGWVE